MRKTSVSDSDGDETVHSKLSHGIFVTLYDQVALPNYLVHLPSHNYFIIEIGVEEELNERENGGDSDDDGDNAI